MNKMAETLSAVGLGAALVLLAGDVQAESMRCGDKVVSRGDGPQRVRSICGAPTSEQRRVQTRSIERSISGPCRNGERRPRCWYTERVTVDVVIDEWVYDFGKRRLVHHVVFEDGALSSVRTSGYGQEQED